MKVGLQLDPDRGSIMKSAAVNVSMPSNQRIKGFESPIFRASVRAENSVPEEMDHRKIAAGMPVVDEMLLLFASEPCKSQEPRPLYVKFLVEEYMRIERCRTCEHLNDEEIEGQYEICKCPHETDGYEEEGCIVAFVAEVRLRDEVIFRIIGMMEVDVVTEQLSAYRTVAEPVVHQRLSERHHQMRRNGGHKK